MDSRRHPPKVQIQVRFLAGSPSAAGQIGKVARLKPESFPVRVRGRAPRARGVMASQRPFKPPGLGSSPSGPTSARSKPRRGRANLRPPSWSASAIDRLLKNQNPWKIVIIFDHPRRIWSWANIREPRRNFAVRKFMGHKSHSCSDPQCWVQAFDDSTARRSAAAATRGPRPGASRAGWRLRQSHHRLRQAIAVLSSAGDDSRPHHVF